MKSLGRIILASQSPRRKEFFDVLGIPVEVMPSDVAEVGYGGDPQHLPLRITVQKVKAVRARLGDNFEGWVVGADTIVALEREVFGKPEDAQDATRMLKKLSGRTHKVYTAFRVQEWTGEVKEGTVVTDVTFADLTDLEIQDYISSGEPMDKAGAYAIQGKGGAFIKSISGSYSSVVGLPLFEVLQALKEMGAISA